MVQFFSFMCQLNMCSVFMFLIQIPQESVDSVLNPTYLPHPPPHPDGDTDNSPLTPASGKRGAYFVPPPHPDIINPGPAFRTGGYSVGTCTRTRTCTCMYMYTCSCNIYLLLAQHLLLHTHRVSSNRTQHPIYTRKFCLCVINTQYTVNSLHLIHAHIISYSKG